MLGKLNIKENLTWPVYNEKYFEEITLKFSSDKWKKGV